nr:unnamed protein product [Digitaria exilis]
MAWVGQLGAFWDVAAVAKERASAGFIFTHFNVDDGTGIKDKAYILALGLLMSQYSIVGYDASAHMTEETKNADWSGPMGIITSVALSSVFGWVYLVALTSLVTDDIPYLLDPGNDAGGYAVAQALYDAFHGRFGTGVGGLSLGSQVAFQAMLSIATVGQYIAYALPIFFRVTTARRSFVPGTFHLGNYGVVVGWVAVAWVALVTVLFSLPVAYPVAADNFNYTPVLVGGVVVLSVGAWVLHARFWFRGPITNVEL